MGLLTFALDVTLDRCGDRRMGIADDAMLRYIKSGVMALRYRRR